MKIEDFELKFGLISIVVLLGGCAKYVPYSFQLEQDIEKRTPVSEVIRWAPAFNFVLDNTLNSSGVSHILKNSSGCVIELQSSPKGELVGYKMLSSPEICTYRAPNLVQ